MIGKKGDPRVALFFAFLLVWWWWWWWWGVFVVRVVSPVRSSAARAAHRELRSLLRLFLASNA
ncbi:hypothetical protein, partial [Pseudomonas putida]